MNNSEISNNSIIYKISNKKKIKQNDKNNYLQYELYPDRDQL